MKHLVATGNSQISFTDQVLNMKEFTSLIQSEATGPSNTTQQTGTQRAERRHYISPILYFTHTILTRFQILTIHMGRVFSLQIKKWSSKSEL